MKIYPVDSDCFAIEFGNNQVVTVSERKGNLEIKSSVEKFIIDGFPVKQKREELENEEAN